MKKSCCLFLFVYCLSLCAVNADSPDFQSRVAVLPLTSPMDDPRFDSVCSAIYDTVLLTLKLLGKYDVIEDTGIEQFSEESILLYAEREQVDNIIFGNVIEENDGSILIKMSVWDRQDKEIVLGVSEKAEMLFDIFDASDRIVVSLIEGFSGRHIGYGSIYFEPEGAEGSYTIEMNGMFAGRNSREIRKVLIGDYQLSVKQNRLLGSYTLYSDSIEVIEGSATTVPFTVPAVTEKEAEFFNTLDREIVQSWTDLSKDNAVIARLEETIELLDGGGEYFTRQREKYENWLTKIRKRQNRRTSSGMNEVDIRRGKELLRDIDSFLPDTFSRVTVSGPDTSFTQVGGAFSGSRAFYTGDLADSRLPSVDPGDIKVDGRREDWILLPTLITDKRGDSMKPGGDISTVKVSRDEDSVYMLFSVDGESLYASNGVWYQVFFDIPGGNINITCQYWDNTWYAKVFRWVEADWASKELATGSMRRGRDYLEASFPITALLRYLETGKRYHVRAQVGLNGQQLDSADSAVYLMLD